MKARTVVPFVDTNIIPDRNAGMGSLLLDLQNPRDPDREGPPLLGPAFAFIDVGVSRARTAIALKTLLASDLAMDVVYVATERPESVPFAHVKPSGDSAEEIHSRLSGMISSNGTVREVEDWHCVVDRNGKVSAVAYSYELNGNEVWEAYFMGRPFIYSGETIEFSHSELDESLASDVSAIEARIEWERERESDPGRPGPSWDGYALERDPLEAGLAAFGISLQKTDVPRRIEDRQNVLFLGNVLNLFSEAEQIRELDRIAANMEEGDLVIVQVDEVETSHVEVLRVNRHGAKQTRDRVRWIDTRTLEVQKPVRGRESWQQIRVKPVVDRMVDRLVECLETKMSSPEWSRQDHKAFVRRNVGQVFRTFFRAMPVEETLRIAIREALRRLTLEGGSKGVPVFEDDAREACGSSLGLDRSPVVSEADLVHLVFANPGVEEPERLGSSSDSR